MDSDNPIGADNQQETKLRALDPQWVVGFVDGEGCFSVSIHRNELARPTGGWHIQPTFQVSQHRDHKDILHALVRFFGGGTVRTKGANSLVDVYVVHSTRVLLERVIPFFEMNQLRVKRRDFESFAFITRAIRTRSHHRPDVFTGSGATCLLDECEGQTAQTTDRGDLGILRDYTRGTAEWIAGKI